MARTINPIMRVLPAAECGPSKVSALAARVQIPQEVTSAQERMRRARVGVTRPPWSTRREVGGTAGGRDHFPVTPSDLLSTGIMAFVVAPIVAAVLAFKGGPSVRPVARFVLLCGWLANTVATVACLRAAFGRPSSGIGNGVFFLIALPVGFFTILWFAIWRAARRHAYVISLPPEERRVEELHDIDRALEAARESLARDERRLQKWLISGDERARLRDNVEILRAAVANLERERAKRA